MKSSEGWNSEFGFAYQLEFSPVTTEGNLQENISTLGSYRIVLMEENQNTSSPYFVISSEPSIDLQLISNSLFFFTAQRDGPDVNTSVMHRKPSHLADEQAYVYDTPIYQNDEVRDIQFLMKAPSKLNSSWRSYRC